MTAIRAVVFDLGGTLVDWPDWDDASPRHWAAAWDAMARRFPGPALPSREPFIAAMCQAETDHWKRVETEHWSGPPTGLVHAGFRALGRHAGEEELLAALDGYSRSVEGWSDVFPDSRATIVAVRARGLRVGLLSNTWWAAEWHDADLATHGLADLIDEVVYTSDLAHSKPHPSVFHDVAGRLGVKAEECVFVGDRPVDDIHGALSAGMRGVWKTNGNPRPNPTGVVPTATIHNLGDLLALLAEWGAGG